MSPAEYLELLGSKGVSVTLDESGAGLRIRAPKGVLTPAVTGRIRAVAPALLPLLGHVCESVEKPLPEADLAELRALAAGFGEIDERVRRSIENQAQEPVPHAGPIPADPLCRSTRKELP